MGVRANVAWVAWLAGPASVLAPGVAGDKRQQPVTAVKGRTHGGSPPDANMSSHAPGRSGAGERNRCWQGSKIASGRKVKGTETSTTVVPRNV